HFDVQPPAPLELWESDPFELDIRGEWAYGRGVADDKGQLWLVLKAAQRLVEAGALPVNLRIAYDGEEEIGGHTIADWVTEDERGADACVIFDGGMLRRDVPTIELATRRLAGAQPLDAKAGEEFYVRTWAEPSADVNGIIGGKPGVRNTTLSVAASAELSIRLAPGQDAETIGDAAVRLLLDAAPKGAELEIVV